MTSVSLSITNIDQWRTEIKAGDMISLSGTAYTSRDAAHARITELIKNGGKLPFELKNAVIYYAGPTPASPLHPVGSFGPTTSARMDKFAPMLYGLGLAATIGKGERSEEVRQAIIRNKGIYLIAIGGAGAIASAHISSCREIAFHDLGCESVKEIVFDNFPLITAIDSEGRNIYEH